MIICYDFLIVETDVLVSISSTFYVQIFRTNVVFSSYMYVEKKTFVRKISTFNVDETDVRMYKN